MRITIRQSDVDAMTEHARKLSPEEACGLIAGEDKTDGSREIRKVFFLTNTDHTTSILPSIPGNSWQPSGR